MCTTTQLGIYWLVCTNRLQAKVVAAMFFWVNDFLTFFITVKIFFGGSSLKTPKLVNY